MRILTFLLISLVLSLKVCVCGNLFGTEEQQPSENPAAVRRISQQPTSAANLKFPASQPGKNAAMIPQSFPPIEQAVSPSTLALCKTPLDSTLVKSRKSKYDSDESVMKTMDSEPINMLYVDAAIPDDVSIVVSVFIFGYYYEYMSTSDIYSLANLKTKFWCLNPEIRCWLFPTYFKSQHDGPNKPLSKVDTYLLSSSPVACHNMKLLYGKAKGFIFSDLSWVTKPTDWRNFFCSRILVSLGHFNLFEQAEDFYAALADAIKNYPDIERDKNFKDKIEYIRKRAIRRC